MRVVVIGGWAPSLIKFRGPLLQALVAHGHEVITMAADPDEETRAALSGLGVRYEEIKIRRNTVDPAADMRTLSQIAVKLRAIGPDLSLSYAIKPIVYGCVAARLARVPRRAALVTGLGYPLTGESLRRKTLTAVTRRMYRVALRQCDTIFFQNPDNLAEFEKHHMVNSHARVEIIRGSGVDISHYAYTPVPAGPPVFVFVGRLLNDKGFREYVEMALRIRRRHPGTRFQVVGWFDTNRESVSEDDLRRWIADGTIEYLGEVKDVRPLLAAAHVLVLPSYWEGTPRSVLEAMSMGRAVITTVAPGCRETVIDGDSGLLVPVRNADALVAAGERLIADRSLIERLAARARRRAEELYDARKVAARMLEVIGI